MSANALAAKVPFVTSLRSRPGIVRLGSDAGARLAVRVELPEQWDTIAFDVPASASVGDFKKQVLDAFGLRRVFPEDFVLKLNGFEVLGDATSIAAAGALDGSTFLLTYRRRRPVR
jgi:hypothetical protein